MNKTCTQCQAQFALIPEDQAMYDRAGVPATEKCANCNWAQLLSFWVLGRFRVAKSALSGKQIITNLPETAPFPIYEREEFISDAWDPMVYARDYDPNRPFLDQLVELQSKVPHPHQIGNKNINCQWTDDWWESRECYLCRSGIKNEFLSYAYRVVNSKESIDLAHCFDMEQSYDCLFCFKCYRTKYSFDAHDCVDSAFLYNCRNCSNCFMSWNLRNKQYCILNQQYTKEEYAEKMKQYNLKSYAAVQQLKAQFARKVASEAVHRANFNVQVANTTGNFMTENKNCTNCHFLDKAENCRQVLRGYQVKDTIEGICCGVVEQSTRTALDQYGYGNTCVLCTTNCRYSTYLDGCEDCEYCFGCIGLKKKKYCILNKQYTKEQYEELVAKIKLDMQTCGEWGKFMPFAMAYGGYNVSLAQVLFPKTKEQVAEMGAKWEDAPVVSYQGAVSSDELPDSIEGVTDEITKQRIICVETKLSYNIAPRELTFYKTHGIPLPQRHFDHRTFERYKPMALMFKPQKGICYYCKQEVEHYYDPSLNYQKIACVPCYQKEIA